MHYIILLTLYLFINYKEINLTAFINSNISHETTASVTKKYFNYSECEKKDSSGFYLVINDTTNSIGYKLRDKNEFFFIAKERIISLSEIDSVCIEYNSYIDRYTLSVEFNKNATKKWFAFTSENNGMFVGLFLEGELYHVAKIIEPIDNGKTVLTNAEDKNKLIKIKTLIEQGRYK